MGGRRREVELTLVSTRRTNQPAFAAECNEFTYLLCSQPVDEHSHGQTPTKGKFDRQLYGQQTILGNIKVNGVEQFATISLHRDTGTHVPQDQSGIFSERVINIWNQLPVSTDFRSLRLFMHSVRGMDLSCYLLIQF